MGWLVVLHLLVGDTRTLGLRGCGRRGSVFVAGAIDVCLVMLFLYSSQSSPLSRMKFSISQKICCVTACLDDWWGNVIIVSVVVVVCELFSLREASGVRCIASIVG